MTESVGEATNVELAEAINHMRPDLIKLFKHITKSEDCWFIYCFINETYNVCLNYMLHRFKGVFSHSIIVQAYAALAHEFASQDIEYMLKL